MQNDITVSNAQHSIAFTVAKTQLPFGNNFVQNSAKVVKYNGKDEVIAFVTCTADSKEPGRIYACAYNLKGKLQGCNTIN
jgi:hypothetical protein